MADKAPGKVLIVDDDRNLLGLMKMRLESSGYAVATALNDQEAKTAVAGDVFDLAIVDLQLGEQDGISLMEDLHRVLPDMPVIILTAHGSIGSAVEAMKRGATTISQSRSTPGSWSCTSSAPWRTGGSPRRSPGSRGFSRSGTGSRTSSRGARRWQRVLEVVSRIAPTDSTVYIHGESGTGKELIARALHLASGRKDKPFVAINCAALPETLLESELFGHEKGSFTGAVRTSKGLFVAGPRGHHLPR